MTDLKEVIAHWDNGEGKPYKGQLIDWSAYDPGNFNIGCMCAQGQVLHLLADWSPERLRDSDKRRVDREVANVLNISLTHSVLLRQVNDTLDGAPSIVLTDPGRVLGDQWSRLLDFWYYLDKLGAPPQEIIQVASLTSLARIREWDKAWRRACIASVKFAGESASRFARLAASDGALYTSGAASGASNEIQGEKYGRGLRKTFFFLPIFGFTNPKDIPAREAYYGRASQTHE